MQKNEAVNARTGTAGRKRLLAAVFFVLVSFGTVLAQTWDSTEGVGSDLEAEKNCLNCHTQTAAAWGNLSSHKLLFDCTMCHPTTAPSGAGHAQKKKCDGCHSNASHPSGAACGDCHSVHGSTNAFLLNTSIRTAGGDTVSVHVTTPEGASTEGLVRAGIAGVQAGTGLCEVCHENTLFYKRAGNGAAHATEFCGHCHDHEKSFAAKP